MWYEDFVKFKVHLLKFVQIEMNDKIQNIFYCMETMNASMFVAHTKLSSVDVNIV